MRLWYLLHRQPVMACQSLGCLHTKEWRYIKGDGNLEGKRISNASLYYMQYGANPIKIDCLFDLILYAPSTIFQLCRDGSSWVEPVLS